MGRLVRNVVLGIICVGAAATRLSAQATGGLLPQGAKIPLSRIPRVNRAPQLEDFLEDRPRDRKSTRLNSSHTVISYAVFCLKKKKNRLLKRLFVSNNLIDGTEV